MSVGRPKPPAMSRTLYQRSCHCTIGFFRRSGAFPSMSGASCSWKIHRMCAHQKPRLMVYGSQSRSTYWWCVRWLDDHQRIEFCRHGAEDRVEELYRPRRFVALVGEEAVIAGAD